MKRILITAGLACAIALPVGAAQTATPSGQSGQTSGSGAQGAKPAKPTTPTGSGASSGSGAKTSSAADSGAALAPADKTFAMKAAEGGLAEVQMGKLAAQNASSPDVKQFGQKMADDHGKANEELTSWASKNGVTLPTDLDAKHKAEQDKLSKLSGAAFDRAYMTAMVADHNKDVAEFKKASTTAKNADLKAWAAKTLPTLEEHQTMAKDTSAKVKGSAGAASEPGTAGTAGTPKSPTTPKEPTPKTPKTSGEK